MTSTGSRPKLDVAVGPQLPKVTTQQTLAAHGCHVQSNWDAVHGRSVHKTGGTPSLWPPWRSPKKQPLPVSNHPSRDKPHTAAVNSACYGSPTAWGVPLLLVL